MVSVVLVFVLSLDVYLYTLMFPLSFFTVFSATSTLDILSSVVIVMILIQTNEYVEKMLLLRLDRLTRKADMYAV